ncbi:hypothetical protein [Cryobacterium psychrophilum]|uniref:Uncharacterized protein n=1 Tax=Cryobacterium psychrophilum TaxID=41988 RepID=A0A4Y8KND2_9MICO|nr:hypothetical protein [Cryobacterium psychrophilum]TDW29077.1 hypothetical protein EDD25_0755 [Cryobacterium psychrophilum]TFD79711.1 hypothetical protein E3T53_06765 [Cryobacterium psychrophilum]
MISTANARALLTAGLIWRPASGDAFRIEQPGFDYDVFTVSAMAIEPHEFDTGTILGFNGTTEWALDSLALENALWLPREDQLREMLGRAFRALERTSDARYLVVAGLGEEQTHFTANEAADAYASAVLASMARTEPR